MLKDTIVVWGGEFGRTPMVQGGTNGRDHHPNAFTMWLAGGGIKPGITIGESDDLGFNITKDEVPARMQGLFTRADSNGDGVITKDELDQMVKKRIAAMQRHGGPE